MVLRVCLICLFGYFCLCWVSVAAHGLSLVAKHGGYPLVVAHGFPTEVASLVVKHRL